MRVDIWSDLVCHWWYLGKRRFETALAIFSPGAPVEVVHRSFQLDPTLPKGQPLRARDMLMRKYQMAAAQVIASQDRLERLAAVEGLEYHLAESHTATRWTRIIRSATLRSDPAGMREALEGMS